MNVLLYIKKLFHVESMFNLTQTEPLCKVALESYRSSFPEFLRMCKLSVDQSQDRKFNNHPSILLKLSEHEPAHDRVLAKIKETSAQEDFDAFESKDAVRNWFFQNFHAVVSSNPE